MEKFKINVENNLNNILSLNELNNVLTKNLNNNVYINNSSNNNSRYNNISKQKNFTINFNSTQSFLYNFETNFTDITPTGVVTGSTTVTNSDVVSASVLVATTSTNTTGSSVNSDHHVVIIDWKEILIVSLLCLLIVITVIGNTLVILAVITTRRLRTVTNCFVMSLAIADWLVGIFVMPPAIPLHLMGSWQLGWILCDIWISLDVLLCTASILSLCAISIDRYLAVTQPLNYSRRRRSKRLALLMILVVWILALAITCPPILGWYEPDRNVSGECRYNQNEGYVVFSAMGSFFIPMAVMIYVYLRISCVVAARHDEMTEIEVHKKTTRSREHDLDVELDQDVSEQEPSSPRSKNTRNTPLPSSLTTALSKTTNDSSPNDIDLDSMNHETNEKIVNNNKNGHYELVHTPSMKRNVTVTYKQQSVDKWSNSSANYHQNHNHQHNHHHHHHPSVKSSNSTDCCVTKNVRVHQKSLSSRISSLKRESKTTQTLSIVVGGFIACWLPFFINYLITPFIPTDFVNPVFQYLILWLGWINSAINPFIYAFYSVDFRAAFWRLTLRRFFKATRKPPYTSNTVSIRR